MTKELLRMIKKVECSNSDSLLLHKNPTEDALTYYGIYEKAHPNWYGWSIIKRYLANIPDLKECSRVLANVSDLNKRVEIFYLNEFFYKMKLDLVQSEHKQLEIMCLAINIGITPAVKVLQEALNVKIDGIIGQQTINALNAFDESLFDRLFDLEEKEYYDGLVENKPRFKLYQQGWHNRAEAV